MFFLFYLLLGLIPQEQEERTLSFSILGTVKEVLVKPGDTIKAGQVLARLDDQHPQRMFRRWQQVFANASGGRIEREFRTWVPILLLDLEQWWKVPTPEQFSVCVMDYLQLRNALVNLGHEWKMYQPAKTELQEALEELKNYSITSDADGVVVSIHTSQSKTIKPGEAVVTIRTTPRKEK